MSTGLKVARFLARAVTSAAGVGIGIGVVGLITGDEDAVFALAIGVTLMVGILAGLVYGADEGGAR